MVTAGCPVVEWRALIQAPFSRGACQPRRGREATYGAAARGIGRACGDGLRAGRSCHLVGASSLLGGCQQCAGLSGLLLRCGLACGRASQWDYSPSAIDLGHAVGGCTSIGQLLVNGDLASAVLFGGVLLWAVVEVMLINHQEGKPPLVKLSQSLGREGLAIVITLGLYGAVAYVHGLLGCPVHG